MDHTFEGGMKMILFGFYKTKKKRVYWIHPLKKKKTRQIIESFHDIFFQYL